MTGKYNLDQTFHHHTATHEYDIGWTRIGNHSAPSLVFIHGTPWSSVVWHDLAASLSSRYNIYLYDHPGFGSSPGFVSHDRSLNFDVELDGSLRRRAEASAALFNHWDFKDPPHVVCHDNGGLVALRLLLRHGMKMASLCLIDVVALGSHGLPFFKLVAENQTTFEAIPPHLLEGFVHGYVKSAAYKPLSKDIEDMLCAPWLMNGSQGPKSFLREMIQAHHRDARDVESDYDCVAGLVRTKIIWGADDAWIPAETAQRLGNILASEEVVIVEEAGHLIHYDQPSRLAVEVALWLKYRGRDRMAR